jgi:hypothetical protein
MKKNKKMYKTIFRQILHDHDDENSITALAGLEQEIPEWLDELVSSDVDLRSKCMIYLCVQFLYVYLYICM